MLLLAYTPRPPSIVTDNMLRCAYRAGLKGIKLDAGWKCPNRKCGKGTTNTIGSTQSSSGNCNFEVAAAESTHSNCKRVNGPGETISSSPKSVGKGFDSRHESSCSSEAQKEEYSDIGRRNCRTSGGDEAIGSNDKIGSISSDPGKRWPGKASPGRREPCRPVLLAFRLFHTTMPQETTTVIKDGDSTAAIRISEKAWFSESKQAFPDLTYEQSVGASPVGRFLMEKLWKPQYLAGAFSEEGEDGSGESDVTAEDLWGVGCGMELKS